MDDRDLVRDSLRRLLAEPAGPDLPDRLCDFGWFELWSEDPGGAARALFGQQGELLVDGSPMLETVMAGPLSRALGVTADPWAPAWVPLLAPPGRTSATRGANRGDGRLLIDGLVLGDPRRWGAVAVLLDDGRLVAAPTSQLRLQPVAGLDPWLGLVRVSGTPELGELTTLLDGPSAQALWREVVAAGQRALAEELLGVVAAALALAVEHAHNRRQFGHPIGAFQAVKHRLAEVHVAAGAARAAIDEAWAAGDPLTARLAKSWAGRAARTATRHCQQVLGGMGFTWEHRFHRLARRALVLDSLLGSSEELRGRLGAELCAGGAVPRVGQL